MAVCMRPKDLGPTALTPAFRASSAEDRVVTATVNNFMVVPEENPRRGRVPEGFLVLPNVIHLARV